MPRKAQDGAVVGWAYTLNNPTPEEIAALEKIDCKWHIGGMEVGEQGTPHIQGAIILHERKRCTWLQQNVNPRAHFGKFKGTPEDNRVYCSKEGKVLFEVGVCPHTNNKRSRAEACQTVTSHLRTDSPARMIAEFAEEDPEHWMMYGDRMLRNHAIVDAPPLRVGVKAYWFVGPPGVGKSRLADNIFEGHDVYFKQSRGKWWNGYIGQRRVVINEIAKDSVDIVHMLNWLSEDRVQVETKGGMYPFKAREFIITSNYEPKEVFSESNEISFEALLTRLQLIWFRGPCLRNNDKASVSDIRVQYPTGKSVRLDLVEKDKFFSEYGFRSSRPYGEPMIVHRTSDYGPYIVATDEGNKRSTHPDFRQVRFEEPPQLDD